MAEPRNLVICCAGDESTHPQWLEQGREYDLCVIYYGSQESRYRDEVEHWLEAKGTKSQLLVQLFEARPELLDQYEYFWIPDDDLGTCAADINRIFGLFADSGFHIGQPSLTRDSHCAFSVLTQKDMGTCETTFVEIMCPLFTAASLRKYWPLFRESVCGWGIDVLWSARASQAGEKIGIFDQVAVAHHRPLGSGEWYRQQGIDPMEEVRKRNGLPEKSVHRRLPARPRLDPLHVHIPKLPALPPIIVGGQGGSCTRAVAEILLRTNRVYLDMDSQGRWPDSLDSLAMRTHVWRKGLINPWFIRAVLKRGGGADYEVDKLPERLVEKIHERMGRLLDVLEEQASTRRSTYITLRRLGEKWCNRLNWGWKEPRSMYYLPFFKRLFGTFRFIHVVRDVRGIRTRHIEGTPEFHEALFGRPEPDEQLAFERVWARGNLEVNQWAMRNMPDHYYLLNVEKLAGGGETARLEINQLVNFLGINFVDREKVGRVFRPLRDFDRSPRSGLVAGALEHFGYPNSGASG